MSSPTGVSAALLVDCSQPVIVLVRAALVPSPFELFAILSGAGFLDPTSLFLLAVAFVLVSFPLGWPGGVSSSEGAIARAAGVRKREMATGMRRRDQ